MATTFTAKSIEELILSYLGHIPTKGQECAANDIASFIIRFRENVGFILVGYAGTGKTTLVGAMVKALPILNIQTVLLAPTGRAAKVLSSYSQREAFTIHKYIYYSGVDESGFFRTSLKKNKLRNTLFIVDEGSMMSEDEGLLSDLFSFVYSGYQCRLMFIGDTAQLPPVGSAQSPALDVDFLQYRYKIEIGRTELTQVLRQKKMSSILENATRLRQRIEADEFVLPVFSMVNQTKNPDTIEDFLMIKSEDFEDILHNSYGNYSRNEIVFITRSNKRANLFNKMIRERVLGMDDELSAGDLLMIVKNNYYWTEGMDNVGFLANGDMIEILKVKKYQDIYGFRFADIEANLIDYPNIPALELKICMDSLHINASALSYEQNKQLWEEVMKDYSHLPNKAKRIAAVKQNSFVNALQVKYSYSLTCHKTQGGQWPIVFVDLGYFTENMLDSDFFRWLYTALTRGIEKVYLVGFDNDWFTVD